MTSCDTSSRPTAPSLKLAKNLQRISESILSVFFAEPPSLLKNYKMIPTEPFFTPLLERQTIFGALYWLSNKFRRIARLTITRYFLTILS